ncbi:hypothetical protein C8R44DRAFT_754543 [Mycena epipterygia]|nr:hypothetical protein C8R44DRAFT_754543 [Mycena epipterygia]
MPPITLGRFRRDAPDFFGVKYDGRVRRSNAFERVRQISSSVEPEPELRVQVQQIVEPEPELCVQFGSVQRNIRPASGGLKPMKTAKTAQPGDTDRRCKPAVTKASKKSSAATTDDGDKHKDQVVGKPGSKRKQATTAPGTDHDAPTVDLEGDGAAKDDAMMDPEALAHENAELKRLLAAVAKHPRSRKRPRPAGTAGTNFNIQDAMGLGRGRKNWEFYKTFLCNLRDLAIQAGVNWEIPWSETSVEVKNKLFEVARKRHVILQWYYNDWATAEIFRQFIKNRRNSVYRQNTLEVPEKYHHLKANAAKRNPEAPRGREATLAKVDAAKKKAVKRGSTASGKGKAKAVVSDDEDDKDLEPMDVDEDDESD